MRKDSTSFAGHHACGHATRRPDTGRALAWGRCRAVVATVALLVGLTVALMPTSTLRAAETVAAEAAYDHTMARGDTLIGLGRRYLVDPARWPELAAINGVRNDRRIPLGSVLKIPLRLMRSESASAVAVTVSGDVRTAGGARVTPGQALPEGTELQTGEGNVTVKLVDGTVLRLRAASQLTINESNRVPQAGIVRSGVQLKNGQVEIKAQPTQAGKPGFRVGTPEGVLGVRGTEFRVHTGGGASATRGEVLEGSVAAKGAAALPGQLVKAGFGVVVDSTGRVSPPVALLAAPDLASLPALLERPLIRFTLPAQAGAQAYAAQVARDTSFEQVLADQSSATPNLRIADLPDGEYVLRVRAVDSNGLQGLDAQHRFRLKARPEPPLPSAPKPRAVLSGDRVEFAWTRNPDAQSYRFQLSRSEDFSAPVRDLKGQTDVAQDLTGLAPGTYHWRVASERSPEDQGPFGEAHRFELRALPPAPAPATPKVGEDSVLLTWAGLPGQTFDVQVARDAGFATRLVERRVDTPSIELALKDSGRYFVRLRARDADGFVGPYNSAQQFDIPNCLRDGSSACIKASGQSVLIGP